MEEEIIIPEEETFEYDKLRYILDKNGYVCHVSLGALILCDLGECTEYTGEIPNGYSTIEEWYDGEINKLNAWKITEGNLVFDDIRYNELQEKCKLEEIDNSCVTHKELYGLQKTIEDIQDVNNSQYTEATTSGKVIIIDNVKKVYPRIKLTNIDCYSFNKVDVIVCGKNILPNTALTQEISGITFTQNEDRSITIDGTSTEEIEYNIGGTSYNTSPFLCLKKNVNYYLSSNNQQIKMYYYDGTSRTEIYGGNGGSIKFTDNDRSVTQIVLSIPKGKTFDDVTIFPQLEVGSSSSSYEMYISNLMTFDFSEYIQDGLFPSDNLYPSDDLFPCGTTIEYILIENGKAYIKVNGEIIETECYQIHLFDGFNTVYTLQDTNIEMNYCVNNLKLEGTITKNNNFKVLLDGSIEAHNGNFSGTINASNGVIGGFTLGTNKFSANISTTYNFTLDDANKVMAYVKGEEALTDEELELYDVNGDGVVDRLDLLAITRMYYEYISNVVTGTLEINSLEAQRTLVLRDENRKIKTSIGLNGTVTPNLSCEHFTLGGVEQPKILSGTSLPEEVIDGAIFLLYE
jgi:hypothetical protein